MGSSLEAPGANAVHLCIDMQNLFAPGGPWATPWMEKTLPSVARLVSHNPARTVFTRFIPPEDPSAASGMWRRYYEKWSHVTRARLDPKHFELLPGFAAFTPPAATVDRMVYSAFGNGRLRELLARRNVDTLIVSGAETDVCVLSTVLAAIDFGYRVILIVDALCSSSDEMHDAIIGLYANRFEIQIDTARVEEILGIWKPE